MDFTALLVAVTVYREYTSRAGKVTIMWWYAIFELWFADFFPCFYMVFGVGLKNINSFR